MNRISLVHVGSMAVVCLLNAGLLAAQETRAQAISEERAAKAESSASPTIPERGMFTRAFAWAANKMDGSGAVKDGIYPDLGALIPGSGLLSAGAGYRHRLVGDSAVMNASAAGSTRRYSMVQSSIKWPRLFSDHLSVGAQIKYQDFTQINYFGIGPDTSKGAQTDYRLQNVDVLGSAAIRPREWLALGGRLGYLRGNGVKPGLSLIHPSTDQRFDESSAPGLTTEPRYAHADASVEVDRRDVAGYPTSGGFYRVGLEHFTDLDRSGHSFRRVDMDGVQYVPLFHRNWVIAVRGRVTLSQTTASNQVPFYFLPTLGGDNTLRAYSDYRFRDRNVAELSAEYRWPLFQMMDAALFVDAGRLAPTAHDLWRTRLNRDYGVGFRVHSTTRSIARIDIAKGPEGMRVIARLTAPLGATHHTVVPYVP